LLQQGGLGGPYAWTTPLGVINALAGLPTGTVIQVGGTFVANDLIAKGALGVGNLIEFGFPVTDGTMGIFGTGSAFQFYFGPDTAPSVVFTLDPSGNGVFTGTVSGGAPTAPGNLTTMAWVQAHTLASFNGHTGAYTLMLSDITGAGGAPINSPSFIGTPLTPTAAASTNTPQVASCSFVQSAISAQISNMLATTSFVNTFNSRTGTVTLTAADVTGVGGALLASPALTGAPTAPTAAPGTNNTQIATTAFVTAATGGITGFAPINSPAFTGTPTAPTPTPGNNTTQLATTAFVTAAVVASTTGVSQWNGRTGAVVLTAADVTGVGGALLASPTFTGTPAAPTAAPGTSTTQIASTAFVGAAITAGAVASFNSRTGAVNLLTSDITGAGGAPIASPTFTGTPAAPTATAGTSTTQIATTAFVAAATAAAVVSWNGRVGAVTLLGSDITAAGGALLASPAFTGTPTAPTAAPATNTTQVATTAYVMAAGFAPLASPAFTGTPTAPTPAAADSTTKIATTAFVKGYTPASIPSNIVTGVDADFSASITMAASDSGKIKNCTSASAVVVTLPNNLPKDFYCTVTQAGTGNVTFAAGAGASLYNRQGLLHTAGQWAICCLLVSSNSGGTAATYILGGDCA
jgi:hypothetical protein